jgi:cytochrome P450
VVLSEDYEVADAAWFDANRPDWRGHPLLFHVHSTTAGDEAPEHSRLRRLVSRAFTGRRIDSLRPFVAELTDRLLDELAERADQGGPVDLQEAIGLPVSIAVMARLLGVPDEDLPPFLPWVRKCAVMFEIAVTPVELAEGDLAYGAMREYFTALVARRREQPRDDLTSALIAADDDGDRLSRTELLDTLCFLFAAGFETTAGMVGNAVVALDREPAQRRALLADLSGRLPAAIEELARVDGSIQMTRRVAARDLELQGVPIPAGTSVVVLLGAANRDPEFFPDPDTLDLARTGSRPLGFGLGPHYRLGAALVRMELEEVLGRLYTRFPGLRPAGPPERAEGLALRRYRTVPVALTPS